MREGDFVKLRRGERAELREGRIDLPAENEKQIAENWRGVSRISLDMHDRNGLTIGLSFRHYFPKPKSVPNTWYLSV